MVQKIRQKMQGLAEEDYKEFNKKLIPGVDKVMGIRLPALRKLAKEIAKEDFHAYLDEMEEQKESDLYHEEIMCQGMVLGYARMDQEERRKYLDEFVPKITNWAVCDSCVT